MGILLFLVQPILTLLLLRLRRELWNNDIHRQASKIVTDRPVRVKTQQRPNGITRAQRSTAGSAVQGGRAIILGARIHIRALSREVCNCGERASRGGNHECGTSFAPGSIWRAGSVGCFGPGYLRVNEFQVRANGRARLKEASEERHIIVRRRVEERMSGGAEGSRITSTRSLCHGGLR